MASVQIAGKDINLVMDTEVYDEFCQRGYFVETIDDQFAGKNRVKMLCEMISIMGTHGTGEKVEEEWVRKNLKFNQHGKAKAAIIGTIIDAMKSETAEDQGENETVDVVLEEIEKKKEPTG